MDASPSRRLRIALAQINVSVGDLEGNTARIIDWIGHARASGCDLVAFPELAITGYPPEDLLLKPSFIHDNRHCLERVVAESTGIAVVCGFVDLDRDLFNAAAFAYSGELRGIYHKIFLPNYGVFDEERYFQRGRECPIFELAGVRIGLSICEDIWYPNGPVALQAREGAELVLSINGSPFHKGKRAQREIILATRAMDSRAYVAYVNLVGGQDELVFDGNSAIFTPDGDVLAHGVSFQEQLLLADLDIGSVVGGRLHDIRLRREAQQPAPLDLAVREIIVHSEPRSRPMSPIPPMLATPLSGAAEIYAALVTGTRDYVGKNGFSSVLIGLSGGIDSSLTAAIATDALGAANVTGVLMPSRYSSPESSEDATQLATALGISTLRIPIMGVHSAFERTLADTFRGTQPGIAEENIQARIRGDILMGLSNKFGHLLLTTGNKSELATGYCTLYGDMAGGFAVIKDVPKTLVYEVARYRNARDTPVIPERVLSKPPSAELRPGQRDTDDLPPFDQLDPILTGYVEDDRSFEELVAAGHPPALVAWVIELVDRSEYKRRQAPPGVKITPRAFGRDRRMPVTSRYRQSVISSSAKPPAAHAEAKVPPVSARTPLASLGRGL